MLQRPYYQEDDRPTILVIHPPGGVVAGDQLSLNVDMQPDSKALISTPAATKFYRSLGKTACQSQTIEVSGGCELEWLPQETLFFDRSSVKNTLVFNLHDTDCRLIAWDIVGLGRPAMQETFENGHLVQSLTVNLHKEPIFIDRFVFSGQSELLSSPFSLAAQTLMATMLFYHADKNVLKKIRALLLEEPWSDRCGISLVDEVLVLRTLDCDLDDLKNRLIRAWEISRSLIIGVPPVYPRIWKT
ncbi:urease accessory protein UreD [Thiomicrorhabdus sp. 6S3-12]|uniref:urease accessory protein UreD n=1 Tax=Thiomicrorhabdus sp. 6S3-12 TaxID=2819681 RepID=UPI001AAE0823|nr:urease accessory protein UreD [Thiomicrorhabdus sp. 6S3-12]